MRATRRVGVIALSVAMVGCAESTVIRSYPPGAKLLVNDHFKGITPVVLTVRRSEFVDANFRVRLEHDGYATADEKLQKRVCGGRIVGGVFTLGFVLLFKRPTCFASPQDFVLAALSGHDVPVAHQPTVDERLQRIQKMRDQGTITNEEYEHYRGEILKDLKDP
jgi:hypothetical protein